MNFLSWSRLPNMRKIILNKKLNSYLTTDLNHSRTPTTLVPNLIIMIEYFIGKMINFKLNSIPELKLTIPHINQYVPII